MKTENFIRALAGVVVLTSAVLVHWVSHAWVLLTAFAGLNLFQSAFTGICPPVWLLNRLGWVDENGMIHWGGRKRW